MKRTSSLVLAAALLGAGVAVLAPGCGLLYNYDDFKTDTGGSAAGTAGSDGGTTSAGGGTTSAGGGTGGDATTSTSGSGNTGGGSMLGDNGDPCNDGESCKSGFCVDGVCCNNQCSDLCETCAATGANGQAGTCHPVPDGEDPDSECNDLDPDVCNGAGQCRCHDSGQNADEVCTDCGPACGTCGAPFVCGNGMGMTGCNTGAPMECCFDAACLECQPVAGECQAKNGSLCTAQDFAGPTYLWLTPINDMSCMTGKRCSRITCNCFCP
jgi:hypothetical protein